MSEQDRVDTPEADDDVEGHGYKAAAYDDPEADGSDDVEGHGYKAAMTQDPESSDSDDDFEAHSFKSA